MPDEIYEHWGYHLLIDISGCNENINNPDIVIKFVKELVVLLDMKPIGDTIAYYIDDETGKGVTAVQVITTSTITFHGDDLGKCVYLDVFSCKPYQPTIVLTLVDEYFSPKTKKQQWLYRDAF